MVSGSGLDQAGWVSLFRERLRSAIQFRRHLRSSEVPRTDSCRLVFSEADFLPGLIADKYNDLVVVQLLTQGMDTADVRAAFLDVAVEEIRPKAIYERRDPRIQELEQLGPVAGGPLFLAEGPEAKTEPGSTIFHLNGLRFHYDVNAGQKTGAFLDQRENYAAAAAVLPRRGARRLHLPGWLCVTSGAGVRASDRCRRLARGARSRGAQS